MAATQAHLESFNVGDVFLTKYKIQGLIGRGGQATVYHCHDTYIDRDVAIKVMADSSDAKPERGRRAQMEARVLCKLHHSNIVHVYDAATTESGVTYIIMELLRGRTLREVLHHLHKLTVREALALGAQIADGVEIAHRQHVIHRDLKPENIFVVDGNTVKVLDFGIAKFLTLTGLTTQSNTLQGTMWYISPEHMQGIPVTARSDIYALGSILYEAISGSPPCLMGLQEITPQSVAWNQISRMPPQLESLIPTVPAHVGQLVQRMLAKEPDKRHGNMAEVAELLRAACQRMDAEAGTAPSTTRELWHDGHQELSPPLSDGDSAMNAAASAVDTTIRTIATPSDSQTSRRWWLVALAIAMGTGIGVVLGFSNLLSSDAAKPQVAPGKPTAESSIAAPARSAPMDVTSNPIAPSSQIASAVPVPSAMASVVPETTTRPAASVRRKPIPRVATTTTKLPSTARSKDYFPPNASPTPMPPPGYSSDKANSKKSTNSGAGAP